MLVSDLHLHQEVDRSSNAGVIFRVGKMGTLTLTFNSSIHPIMSMERHVLQCLWFVL